ncbi:MAG TPA: chalcone isomerase family protein [Myxococcota bacterium]
MKKLALALALSLSLPAAAAEVDGVKLADTATVGGQQLVFNGGGVRSKVIFKVYNASLYVPAKTTSLAEVVKGPRRVQMNLRRNVDAKSLIEALNDGIKDNSTAEQLAAIKPQLDQLTTIMTSLGDVKEGAVVTIDYANDTTTISLNGASKGTIAGADFNAALLRIWLGNKPVQADLKAAMLKGG